MSPQQRVARFRCIAVGLFVVVVPAALTIVNVVNRATAQVAQQAKDAAEPDKAQAGQAEPVTADEVVRVGGVERRRSQLERPKLKAEVDGTLQADNERAYGKAPEIDLDKNPHTKSVKEALETGKHPERLSSLHLPKEFNHAKYKKNPKEYLDIVEPGRIWQAAQPGEGVAVIDYAGDAFQTAEQNVPVVLKAKVTPGAPVTFTSFDLGAFENELTSVTVAADEEGIARTSFTGTSGTINDCRILASSPVTTGQLQYWVRITLPAEPANPAPQ